MVFFYNAEGDLLSLTPKETYQGSNKANTIYFVCPTAPTNAVSVAFKLPNGEFTTPYLMQLAEDTGIEQVVDSNGNKYYLWFFELPIAVTSYKGNVTVQFFIATLESTIATQSAVFMVSKGVTYIEPEQGDTYLEILSQLIAIVSQLDEKQDTLVSGENIKTVNGQSLLGEGDIELNITVDTELNAESENPVQNKVITEALNGKQDTLTAGENITIVDNVISASGGSDITVDTELSSESPNPVQNMVITNALDGKLDKVTTTGTWRVYTINSNGTQGTERMSPYALASWIAVRDKDGNLCVTDPVESATHYEGQQCVNLNYMKANIGHKYRFTADISNEWGTGSYIQFDWDVKGEADMATIAADIIGKQLLITGFYPASDFTGGTYGPLIGCMNVGSTSAGTDTITITADHYMYAYYGNGDFTTAFGTYAFTVEQIY